MKHVRLSLGVAAAAALTLGLTACAPQASTGSNGSAGSGDTKDSVTVFISGDTNVQDLWQKGLIPAFEKVDPDITVTTTLDLHGAHDQQTLAKLTASVKGGTDPGFDLVDGGFVTASGQAGLLHKVSDSEVPNLKDVPDATIQYCGDGTPYRASSVLLAYDSTKVATPPTTLDGVIDWIKANPGKFAYNSPSTGGSGGAFAVTVVDSKVPDADRQAMRTGYDQSLEKDWDAGFALLKSIGPSLYQQGVYPNGNDQVLDLLSKGAIEMAPVWSDQTITAQKNGQLPATVKYEQIDPAFSGSASCLGIPKTAAHSAAAEKLLDFVLGSQGQQVIAESISGYPVVNLDTLPAAVKDTFVAAHPEQLNPGYFSQMNSDFNNLWDQKVPGK